MDHAIKTGMIALLAFACFKIAAPFISPIVWGGIIAIGMYPIHYWLQEKSGMSSRWTATILTLVMLATLITPTIILTGALLKNAQTLSGQLANDQFEIPPPVDGVADWPLIGKKLEPLWQKAHQDPQAVMGQFAPQLKTVAKKIVSVAAGASLGILIFIFSIIIAGVFMASAKGAKEAVVAIFTRLAGDRGLELTDLSLVTVKSVITGILGIALIQSMLAGLGFVVMDIPAAGIITVVCLVCAVVQIDMLLILIPLSIYSFTTADTGAAVMFSAWNLAVGLSNNILKPILLAKGVDAPMSIIFIGAIGGLMLSGIIGLFVGAVVLVLGYTLFATWLQQTSEVESS